MTREDIVEKVNALLAEEFEVDVCEKILEKWEQEFYRKNKKLIDIQQQKTRRSAEEEAALKELFSGLKR